MSQKTRSLKKEENMSIAKEATNFESDVSRGNILKECFNYNFADSFEVDYEKDIVVIKVEYGSAMVVIKEIVAQVDKLIVACRDQNKLLQVCDEKEKNIKECLTTLRTQLEDSERNEEVMYSKQKEKKDYVEALENVIEILRKKFEEKDQQLEKVKSNI